MQAKGKQTVNFSQPCVPNSRAFPPYSALILCILFNWNIFGEGNHFC